eukprot:221768-Amphidinium_carterae.1
MVCIVSPAEAKRRSGLVQSSTDPDHPLESHHFTSLLPKTGITSKVVLKSLPPIDLFSAIGKPETTIQNQN